MAGVTEPGRLATPRAVPETRRAARAMRDEAARRAREESAAVAPDATSAAPAPAAAAYTASPASAPHTASPASAPRTTSPAAAAPDTAATHPVPSLRARPGGRVARRSRPVTSERRAARGAEILAVGEDAQPVRHARPRRLTGRVAAVAALAAGAALLLGSAAMTAAMLPPAPPAEVEAALTTTLEAREIEQLPVPAVEQSPLAADLCALPEFLTALRSGADEQAIVAAGGGEAFRSAVVDGRAPCVDLGDSSRIWAVVDKLRPASPIDYRPGGLVLPDGVRNIEGGALRTEAASALTSLVNAARTAGVGEIALESGFRSYQTQQQTYGRHFAERGDRADQVSARPGYSEHQLGVGADVVACAGACGTLDDLAATPQGQWVAAHAWEHGWIVRYVEGATEVTGYLPEPWHLRYIGPELAKAYHDGGWTSLEAFFALAPAPDYAQ